ncbi:hypothetical protein [Paraburkholderia sp. BCC1886]|uniref:hypothetical protein n=1 Tax=Paraburkholderia sp. BCC1886 TaxID=2562670 RepID=UPI001182722A|nr:hypothetical protein [Paraburkholderia sp. BCC1886]
MKLIIKAELIERLLADPDSYYSKLIKQFYLAIEKQGGKRNEYAQPELPQAMFFHLISAPGRSDVHALRGFVYSWRSEGDCSHIAFAFPTSDPDVLVLEPEVRATTLEIVAGAGAQPDAFYFTRYEDGDEVARYLTAQSQRRVRGHLSLVGR